MIPFTKQGPLTCAEYVKRAGLVSLKEFAAVSGVPSRTLQDWYTTQPKRFEVLLDGAVARISRGDGVIC